MDNYFIVLLEIICAGLSYIAYSRYNKKSKLATIVGALIYTFSGYMLYAAFRNPIVATATISLPLMFLGVDSVLKKNNYFVFIFACIVSAIPIIWDIYPLYITTIFTILYTFIKYFNEYKGKRKFCKKLILLILCYIVSILATSFVTLQTINVFQYVNIKPDFGFTYYDFDYYVKTLYMSSSSAYWAKAYILPIILTILPIAALNFKKNKENRTWLLYFLTLVVLFAIPWFSYILNGFVFEPNKWGFVFSFVLAYIVTINIRNNLIYSPREFKFVKKMLVLYLIIWFLIRSHVGSFALISIILAFVYLIILVSRSIDYKELKENQQFEYAENLKTPESDVIKARVKLILVFALCLNALFFSWYLFFKLNYINEFTKPVSVSSLENYRELSFDFDGKYKDKIVLDQNNLNFTDKYKSVNMIINDYIEERSKIYLIITNLKFNKNSQYTVTAKYDDINNKQTIRDFVRTPNYIKVPDTLIYLGTYDKNANTIKLTLSKGSYTYDDIKIVTVK